MISYKVRNKVFLSKKEAIEYATKLASKQPCLPVKPPLRSKAYCKSPPTLVYNYPVVKATHQIQVIQDIRGTMHLLKLEGDKWIEGNWTEVEAVVAIEQHESESGIIYKVREDIFMAKPAAILMAKMQLTGDGCPAPPIEIEETIFFNISFDIKFPVVTAHYYPLFGKHSMMLVYDDEWKLERSSEKRQWAPTRSIVIEIIDLGEPCI